MGWIFAAVVLILLVVSPGFRKTAGWLVAAVVAFAVLSNVQYHYEQKAKLEEEQMTLLLHALETSDLDDQTKRRFSAEIADIAYLDEPTRLQIETNIRNVSATRSAAARAKQDLIEIDKALELLNETQ
jgi:hypothetical protein